MKLKLDFEKIWQNEKLKFSVLFLGLGILSYWVSREPAQRPKEDLEPTVQIDSLIPAGFVLLPLELVNRDALSSIVGSTAVIDLFSVNSQTLNPAKKIASRVKIIRSPRNPDQFALLIPEQETHSIFRQAGPYFAVIQNRATRGTRIVPKTSSPQVQISYQE